MLNSEIRSSKFIKANFIYFKLSLMYICKSLILWCLTLIQRTCRPFRRDFSRSLVGRVFIIDFAISQSLKGNGSPSIGGRSTNRHIISPLPFCLQRLITVILNRLALIAVVVITVLNIFWDVAVTTVWIRLDTILSLFSSHHKAILCVWCQYWQKDYCLVKCKKYTTPTIKLLMNINLTYSCNLDIGFS